MIEGLFVVVLVGRKVSLDLLLFMVLMFVVVVLEKSSTFTTSGASVSTLCFSILNGVFVVFVVGVNGVKLVVMGGFMF